MVVNKDKYPILSEVNKDFHDTIKVMQYKNKLPMRQDDERLLVFSKVLISLESVKHEMLANIFFVRESFYNAVLKSPFIGNDECPTDQAKDLWSGVVDKPSCGILIHNKVLMFYNIIDKHNRDYMITNEDGTLICCSTFDTETGQMKMFATDYADNMGKDVKDTAFDVGTILLSNFSMIILFKKYAKCEILYVNRKSKIKDNKDRHLNGLDIDISILDCTWFTTIVRSEGFKVRGHFRLQPKKIDGEWTKELIYINEFEKHGYTKTAKIINNEER